jgi:hypothetical protein
MNAIAVDWKKEEMEMLGEGGGRSEGERKTTRRKERGTECESSIERM